MTIRTRKFFGTIALLVLVVVWSLLGMTIAQTPWLANSGLLQAIFYVVAGLGWVLPAMPLVMRLLLGVTVVALGMAGDLFESMLKRSAGVKDSSALIPGHGGVLDRIDALLFAAPVYYVVLRYV